MGSSFLRLKSKYGTEQPQGYESALAPRRPSLSDAAESFIAGFAARESRSRSFHSSSDVRHNSSRTESRADGLSRLVERADAPRAQGADEITGLRQAARQHAGAMMPREASGDARRAN